MSNFIKITGVIHFNVEDVTKKHKNQSEWKKTVMIMFNGEDCEYYSWFINKRFNLQLNKPLRSFHCSFINDRFNDINGETSEDKEKLWNKVKNKYNGKSIDITLNLDVKVNKQYWYFDLNEQSKLDLQAIRQELGLGSPFYDFHCTIGFAHSDIRLQHHEYIHRLLEGGLIL